MAELSDVASHVLTVPIDGEDVILEAVSRSTRRVGSVTIVGIEFLPDQDAARARLSLGLFKTRLALSEMPKPDARLLEQPAMDDAAA